MSTGPASYPGHRFPAAVIHHAVRLYHLFSLSLRDIALILAERGVVVSYESLRRWCLRFGADFAARLRKRRPKPGDTSHMDEAYLTINGKRFYLWRAVDQSGVVTGGADLDARGAVAPREALRTCTWLGAWAQRKEHEKGSLEPGKLTDVILLDRDVLDGDPDRIAGTRVLATVAGGMVRHRA